MGDNVKLTTEQKANIKKWVEALESGKYIKGRNRLFDGNKYCCLGVACVVLGLTPEIFENDYYEFENQTHVLPKSICEKLGISETGQFDDPIYRPIDINNSNSPCFTYSSLVSLNDSDRDEFDFNFIAKVIKEKILGDRNDTGNNSI